MAKKRTTGGPRTRRMTAEDVARRKEYKSRAERDRMWQRRVMIVAALLVGISLLVLAYSVLYEQVLVPRQTITQVNGDEITTAQFQERVRFLRWQTAEQLRSYYLMTGDVTQIEQYLTQLASPLQFGSPILSEMEEDLLIEQEAKARGITVDEAAIDRQVDEFIAEGYGLPVPGAPTSTPTLTPTITLTPLVSPTPSNTPAPTATTTPLPSATPGEDEEDTPQETPTPTVEPTVAESPTPTATLQSSEIQATLEQASSDFFSNAASGADVSRSVIRDVFYYDALREALLEEIGKDVPTEELQVNARHILLSFDPTLPAGQTPPTPTDEQKADALARAEAVLSALQDGEPFADLATQMSDDTGSGSAGGELGWASPDTYVGAFADTVREAELGEIVGPIETEYGYHIIQVNGREVRPLTPSEISSRQQQAFQDWLAEAQQSADIGPRHEDWIDRIPEEPTYNELLGDILPLG